MQKFVSKFSDYLDWLAGWVLMGATLLIVCNVLLRLFSHPIEWVYDWVGFLSATAIGFALAYCALQEGHIAVTLFVDKLAPRLQAVVDIIINLLCVSFLILASWENVIYGRSMKISGEVSMTARIPFYPFVYLIAFGFFVTALVYLVSVIRSLRGEAGK